jgi:hypothetical protein
VRHKDVSQAGHREARWVEARLEISLIVHGSGDYIRLSQSMRKLNGIL